MSDVAIEWHGEEAYSGWDHAADPPRVVTIEPGKSERVSEAKAEQLLDDFPAYASRKGEQPAGDPTGDDGPSADWSKATLDAWAAEHDVPDYPSGRRAKVGEKIAAIEAFNEASSEDELDDDDDDDDAGEPEL